MLFMASPLIVSFPWPCCLLKKSQVFLSSVAVSLDCGRNTGMVQKKKGTRSKFSRTLRYITYPSTPLSEGPASAPAGVYQKWNFYYQCRAAGQNHSNLGNPAEIRMGGQYVHVELHHRSSRFSTLKGWAWCLRMEKYFEFKLCVSC